MTPLLFAVVDAVLTDRMARRRACCGLSAAAETRWVRSIEMWRWWRSCWPV